MDRLRFICLKINALCIGRTVSFIELADKMNAACTTASRLRQIYWFIAEYEADEEWWICLMLNYKIMLDEPEGFTHLIGVSSGIYDPYRVKPVFGLLNSINILTLRDNEEIAFVLRERTIRNSMF